MRKILFSILGLMVSICCEASDWVSHFSYNGDIQDIERIGNVVYAVSDGKLFSYDTSTAEYSTPLKERQNTPITQIACDEKNKKLLIVRDNYEIDVFDGTTFTSIPTLREANLGISKTVNDISIIDGVAYLSLDLGLIVIDMTKIEVKSLCLFQFPFYSTSILDGYLYAATSKGVYRISVGKDLNNFSGWESFPLDEKYASDLWLAFEDEAIRKLATINNRLYFLVPKVALYHLDGTTVKHNYNDMQAFPTSLDIKGDKMYVYEATKVWIYAKDASAPSSFSVASLISMADDANEGAYWVGTAGGGGLAKVQQVGSSYSFIQQGVKPQGPLTNYPFEMNYTGGKIRLVGGGYYYDRFFYPPQLSEFDKNGWFNYADPGIGAGDYTSVDVNPADPTNVFVSTWGIGVFEFKDKAFKAVYDYRNSSLTNINPTGYYMRVDGLKFEGPDKFWVCNTMVKTVINLFQKEGGVWKSYGFDHPEIYIPPNANQGTVVCELMVDSKGNKWVGSMFGTYIVIFNENGTPENLNDDKRKHLTSFYDQDGEALQLSSINRIKEDKKGNIWFATTGGLYMVDGRTDVFNEDIIFRRIELTGSSEAGSVRYLFGKTVTNDIAFDAANRKWVATQDQGVFLMDERGQEVVAHFTRDNSPLPSNKILSIAINDDGHVFMGSDKGVVAFQGALATDMPAKTNPVYVYPNPIAGSFPRNLIVKGLKASSFVKIVDAENNEINSSFASKDGAYEWNGLDTKGEKVSPAAYYLIGTDEDGTEGILSTLRVTN